MPDSESNITCSVASVFSGPTAAPNGSAWLLKRSGSGYIFIEGNSGNPGGGQEIDMQLDRRNITMEFPVHALFNDEKLYGER